MKILVVLVILLVGLFAVGIVLGAARGDGGAPGWMEELRGAFGPRAVAAGDLTPRPQALQESTLVLTVGRPVRSGLGESDADVRNLVLELEGPGEVEVAFQPDPRDRERAVRIRKAVLDEDDRTLEIQVLEHGGRLRLLAKRGTGSPARCRVRIGER